MISRRGFLRAVLAAFVAPSLLQRLQARWINRARYFDAGDPLPDDLIPDNRGRVIFGQRVVVRGRRIQAIRSGRGSSAAHAFLQIT